MHKLEDHDEAEDHDTEMNILQELGSQIERRSSALHLFGRELAGHQIGIVLVHVVLHLIYGVAPSNIEHGHQDIEERDIHFCHLIVRILAQWALKQRLILAPLACQQLDQFQEKEEVLRD